MSRTARKTCLTLLGLALAASGCATSQQPRTAPVQGYNTPSTYGTSAVPPAQYQYARQTVRPVYTDGESMLLDTVFLRPISLVGVAVGAAAWVVSLPFSITSYSAGDAFQALVETPLNYTFSRPLGDITSCRDVDPGCRYPLAW